MSALLSSTNIIRFLNFCNFFLAVVLQYFCSYFYNFASVIHFLFFLRNYRYTTEFISFKGYNCCKWQSDSLMIIYMNTKYLYQHFFNLFHPFGWVMLKNTKYLALVSDVNIRADFVGKFSAYYGCRPRGRFSNLRFGATLTFKLTGGF